jgi:hypothetical protein
MADMATRVCPGCGADVAPEQPTCARCGATMASGTADTVLGMQVKWLDVAALVSEAIDEQKPGEEIDLPLGRVLEARNLGGKKEIQNLITESLKILVWSLGIKPQQAVEQLSRSQAKLKMTPDGKPFVETFTTNVVGLESLSAEARQKMLEQLKRGETRPFVIREPAQASKAMLAVSIVAVLAIVALVLLWWLKH